MNKPIVALPLPELQAFAAVAQARSFRQAAERLGVTPSALSHSVRALEVRLNLRLLHRTTRSVAPTEAGAHVLAVLAPALAEIRHAIDDAVSQASTPQGLLRLSAPRAATELVLQPLVTGFLQAHPRMAVEMAGDDALVDIVATGFDAGVRFGESLQADMVALPIGTPQGFAIVAAPAYLAAHGVPTTPDELARHRCIRQRFPSGRVYAWQLARGAKTVQVQVQGQLTLSDGAQGVAAARAGLGLAYVHAALVAPELAAGRLVQVLADWTPPPEQLYLYYPSRRLQSAGLQAFIDWVRQPVVA
ncbi:LysR family transcriptional regulator [Ottowia sp.]|uniref:LysR family transcriptional regulator n=1 Tax=Ottowia sp. TaxID=1898956 RepID=UPI003A8C6C39